MESFDDIRPYHDDEVYSVLQELLHNEELIKALTFFNFPKLSRFFGPLMHLIVKTALARKFNHVTTVRGFQELIEPYMIKMIQRTTNSVSWSGLDQLSKEKHYLFLSNHRDIVLDPALVIYGLHQDERDTVRVAIGDNLLSKPYISDLMRLNKSFIVKRSATTRKEKMEALKTLSAYITYSVKTENSVWLAHREGRAKDGNDCTDSAIIKMLYFSHKTEGFKHMLTSLNIVPVAISYEINPCDFMKAKELYLRETKGEYVKEKGEDLKNIIAGIQGQKGKVHVAFGHPLTTDIADANSCAAEVDKQIHQLYRLFPINYAAYSRLQKQGEQDYCTDKPWQGALTDVQLQHGKSVLNERLAKCEKQAEDWLLKMYANPVKNRLSAD